MKLNKKKSSLNHKICGTSSTEKSNSRIQTQIEHKTQLPVYFGTRTFRPDYKKKGVRQMIKFAEKLKLQEHKTKF